MRLDKYTHTAQAAVVEAQGLAEQYGHANIDPEHLLNWLYRYTKWMFTPTAVTLCCLFALSALLLVLVQFDVFRARLQDDFSRGPNVVFLFGVSGKVDAERLFQRASVALTPFHVSFDVRVLGAER